MMYTSVKSGSPLSLNLVAQEFDLPSPQPIPTR